MTKRPTYDDLKLLVERYERKIDDMQDRVFFVQDEDGFLRRWFPPTVRVERWWLDKKEAGQ